MLHPVGSEPPGVYWRRRLAVLGSALLLVLIIAWVLWPSHGNNSAAESTAAQHRASTSAATSSPSSTHPAAARSSPAVVVVPPSSRPKTAAPLRTAPTSAARVTSPAGPPGSSAGHAAGSSSLSAAHASASPHPSRSTPPPAPCTPGQLSVSAAVGQSSYSIGDEPVLMLQVVNTGPGPCVQNLADSQVELRVYNGESRVWGSHDCQIVPGTNDKTLAVNQAVRVSIVWSGLTSQPGCAATRQRVGAGTYTLYPYLSGRPGAAAQFSIN